MPQTLVGPRLALACAMLMGSASAHAGWLDGPPGPSQAQTSNADARQRVWPIREFTRIELVAREPGAEANQHPTQIKADMLRQQLAQIQFVGRNGAPALFAADQLSDLLLPLVQAPV